MTQEQLDAPAFFSVQALLRPLARFCVRHSLRLQSVVEALKMAFVEAAEEELQRQGQERSASKICIITGVHRQDIARFREHGPLPKFSPNQTTRVLGRWQQDERYLTKSGKPRVLSADGTHSDFFELVSSVTGDLSPYTVLFELERRGLVRRTPRGVKLLSGANLMKDSLAEGFRMLGRDINDLLCAVEENLHADLVPNLHITTYYDRVPSGRAQEIREWFLREGTALHRKARSFLSKFDLDLNPGQAPADKTVRVVLSAFSRIDQQEE